MPRKSIFISRSIGLILLSVLAGCGSGGNGSGNGSSGSPPAANPPVAMPTGGPMPPVAPIPVTPTAITGVMFDGGSHRRLAPGSDNWPATWSDDDQQYAVWGDGGGFGGDETTGRASFGMARIEGDPQDYRGVNRFGGKDGECPSNIDGKSHGAPLSIGGILYVWITPGSDAAGYEKFTLYESSDKGCSFQRRDVIFDRATTGISFGSFVQFGKDDTAARDGYVYTVATAVTNTDSLGIVQRPGNVMLLRVPAAAIDDRGSYEFYAGLDSAGQPRWSPDPTAKVAIYQDDDGVGPFAQMSYVPGLDRFVYTNQHGDGTSIDANRSLFTMAEAPTPWGPWSVVFHDVFFPEFEASVFQWSFAPKWFRNGGRGFTLIFSGTGSNDSFNTIDGVFTTSN